MRLSIITINYNNCGGLQKTIDSVVKQTWRDFEWIVIDGGSTDGSKELIEHYQDQFSYWCSEPDKGVYNAMNKGIAKARGEWISFMNSGDMFNSPDVLDYVFFWGKDQDILYGKWIAEFGNFEKVITPSYTSQPAILWRENICHQAMFFRKTLFKTGYDESFKIYADWAKNIDFAISGALFSYLPIVICRYDMHGVSNQINELLNVEYSRVRLHYPQWMIEGLEALYNYENNGDLLKAARLLGSRKLYRYPLKMLIRLLMKFT